MVIPIQDEEEEEEEPGPTLVQQNSTIPGGHHHHLLAPTPSCEAIVHTCTHNTPLGTAGCQVVAMVRHIISGDRARIVTQVRSLGGADNRYHRIRRWLAQEDKQFIIPETHLGLGMVALFLWHHLITSRRRLYRATGIYQKIHPHQQEGVVLHELPGLLGQHICFKLWLEEKERDRDATRLVKGLLFFL